MDDVIVRSRYPRRNTHYRKKKNQRGNNSLMVVIARQLVISVLILLAAGIIKKIDVPFTRNIENKIKYVINQNVELKSIYNNIDAIITKIKKGEKASDKKDGSNAANDDSAVAGEMYLPEGDSSGSILIGTNILTPVTGVVSSPFGERMHPIKKTLEFHKGIDIEAANGSSIKAALEGEVIEAGEERTYGKYIKIKHKNGITTVYAHCSKLISEKGQYAEQGDIIAEVGSTGAAVGAHLHFEIWKDEKPLDPSNYIDTLKS